MAPSRSSHTRSVLARFRARFSGYGIFTDVTRLMALRTSSRSAACDEAAPTPSSKVAKRKGLAGWNIWENPPEETTALTDERKTDPSVRKVEPTVELSTVTEVRR